jgi:RIO kinase 1
MKEKHKVKNDVFEITTLKALQKLKSQGLFDKLVKEISLGKEANVFLVEKEDEFRIAKIYRIAVMDFKKLKDYFLLDPRFRKVKSSRYDLIFNWCKKEYRNLIRCYENNVSVPTPLGYNKNVIIEELVGDKRKGIPAPRLKEKIPENIESFFIGLVENIKKMVFDAEVIHGDLSEYNILNHNEKPIIIDLSQSVPSNSYYAYELLKRDLEKIKRFFSKYLDKEFVQEKLNEIMEKYREKYS